MAISFLKHGKEAQEMLTKQERQETSNKSRFFLKDGGEADITFIDGNIVDGLLDCSMYWEHNFKPENGTWKDAVRYVCLKEDEPCPLCEHGDKSYLAMCLTIIDNTERKSEDGSKVWKNQRRLFAFKKQTFQLLQKEAEFRGGLVGCRFRVSRVGQKEAAVGNVFSFDRKMSPAEMASEYGDSNAPINYEEVLNYVPADKLRELGFGGTSVKQTTEAISEAEVAKHL